LSQYKFRPFTPDDLEQLEQIENSLSILYRVSLESCRDYLNWKHFSNPYIENPLIVIAECEGVVAGQYTYTPMRWRHSATGNEENILAPGGAFVLPEHRGHRLLTRMMSFGREWLSPDVRWFLNTSSTKNSARIYKSFGAYPLANRFFYDSCSCPGLFHYCLRYGKKNKSKVKYGHYEGIIVSDEVLRDDLVRIAGRRILPGPAVELKRDAVFYDWRYRNPAKDYTFYYAGSPGDITGYVVVSHNSNNLRGYIVDYGQADNSSLGKIVRFIKKRRDFDILSMYEFCADRDFVNVMSEGGIRENRIVRLLERKVTPFYPLFLIKTRNDEDGWIWDGLDLRDLSSWSMMGAARELD